MEQGEIDMNNAYECIQSIDIDDIDDLTTSESLDHITFYQKENTKKNNMLLSNYFSPEKILEKKYILNTYNLIKEILVIGVLHVILGISNPMFNIITIDGIISSLIFYLNFVNIKIDFLVISRLDTIERYIYYLLLIISYYVLDYVLWFKISGLLVCSASIMISPNIMAQISSITNYRKISNVIHIGYDNLIKKIVCKQLAKIINLIISKCLNCEHNITYEELLPHYDKIDLAIIKLLISACIFNYFDSKTILKYPLIIYKNIMMKNRKYNIANDREYIITILKDKRLDMFLDVYTLNRVIRLLSNDTQNKSNILTEQYEYMKKRVAFKTGRIMICWNIMGSSNIFFGLLSYLLFISDTNRPLNYLINTLIFCIISFLTEERILVLIACELFYTITNSKLLNDIGYDTYCSLKSGIINLCYRIRLETFLITFVASCLTIYNYNYLNIGALLLLNMIIILKLYKTYNNKILKKEPFKIITENTMYINNKTENNEEDILLIARDRLIEIFRNNLLIRILQPCSELDFKQILKMLLNTFIFMICGYLSSFEIRHILALPFVIQNIVDIVL